VPRFTAVFQLSIVVPVALAAVAAWPGALSFIPQLISHAELPFGQLPLLSCLWSVSLAELPLLSCLWINCLPVLAPVEAVPSLRVFSYF
jgi:hypothetical protein